MCLDFPSAESRREFHLAKLSQETQLDRSGDGMVAPGNFVETAVFVSFFHGNNSGFRCFLIIFDPFE